MYLSSKVATTNSSVGMNTHFKGANLAFLNTKQHEIQWLGTTSPKYVTIPYPLCEALAK